MEVILYTFTPMPESVIEMAARCCYDSEDKCDPKNPNGKFLQSLIRNGHLSVLEHASCTFIIDKVSRSLTHQLVRHRLASYSQQSQRYVKMDKFELDDGFSMPDSFDYCEIIDDFTDHMELTKERYDAYIANGIPAEEARAILPNATHTKLYMTMNMRQWREFLDKRGSRHAQKEIRELTGLIHHELLRICPYIFQDYKMAWYGDEWAIERPAYVNSDGWIWYKGKEYKLTDLVSAYERKEINDSKKKE